MQRIWLFVVIIFCLGLVTSAQVGHADEMAFPYQAVVVVPQAEVHSGPGEEYYPTGRLELNEAVEVYRHAPGGWLAVRPPEGSFSWIFDRHVEIAADGLGRINKNEVPSRVGVEGSQQRNVIQIRLHKGEVVELLGQYEEAGQRWYKIAPPAGEFRWLHVDSVGTLVPPAASQAVSKEPDAASEIKQSFEPPQRSVQQPVAVSENNSVQSASAWANVNAPVPNEDEAVSAVTEATRPEATQPEQATEELPSARVVVAAHEEPPMVSVPTIPEPAPKVANAVKTGWLPRMKSLDSKPKTPSRYAAPELFSSEPQHVAAEAAAAPASEPVAEQSAAVAGQTWQPRRKTVRTAKQLEPVTPLGRRTETAEANVPVQQNVAASVATRSTTPTQEREMSAEFTRAVVSMDVRLSQMVTTNRATWQLEPLRQEANTLLSTSQTVAEREAAKHTLGKLDRFAAIQQGFAQVQTIRPPAPTAQPPMVATNTHPANPNATLPTGKSVFDSGPVEIPDYSTARRPRPNRRRRHDAEGILRTASSRRPGAPEYALVNQGGRVVALVSATPDVDLEPFLGKRVGVAGERRYLPEFRKQHVTAGRVLPLGTPLRR